MDNRHLMVDQKAEWITLQAFNSHPATLVMGIIEAYESAKQSNKHSYTVGVEVHKNEWPMPPETKLGKRPTQNPLECEKWCGLPEGHTGECVATFSRDLPTKT